MSFTISRRAKPESKPPGRMRSGHLVWVDPLRPLERLMTSSITAGSSPKRRPTRIASDVTQRCVAERRLLIAFSA